MKRNLLIIGFLALSASLSSQVVCHVDQGATFYVGKNALVYNGGGLQMKGNALYENHGNVMVVGDNVNSVFKTIDAGNVDKTEATGGGNFINKLNEPDAYASRNSVDPLVAPVYTYGQLYVTGIQQAKITGIVNQEYRQVSHGAYQQVGLPFYDKSFSTLSNELGKTFNNTRRSENEILVWNNRNVVFDNLPNLSAKTGVNYSPFAYFSVGGKSLNVSTVTRTLKGRPVADTENAEKKIKLEDAGFNIDFGVGGNKNNLYGGKYNTYLQDNFSVSGGLSWQGDFGRNIYQFGNPYLTNLDLSQIATNEVNGDGNNLSNIYGVRLEVSGVTYNPNKGGGSTNFKSITFGSGVATGDVEFQVVRPMGSFVIKLNNNTLKPDFDFSKLRRFNYHPRTSTTAYDVTAAKRVDISTVKQLGVIGLDADGNEVERTYYVVSNNTVTGASRDVKAQIGAFGGQTFGTFEEDPINGGYDNNNVSYWLYLNEANENDFRGKNIKLVNYNPKIVGFKFEVRENAVLVDDNVHLLSQGEGFYYKQSAEKNVKPILQNATVSGISTEYDLYYGAPKDNVLGANEVKRSATIVVFNPDQDNYFVIFDPSWKTADVQVFDMSGRLVHSASKVSSNNRYVLPLQNTTSGYIVNIVSDKGDKISTKILR
ncbi:T9SS type A sorting domain-containing protein [Chryseobacterium sp. SNU WT5]|uniref:T9SS type A sorting domain-containing protein n=1 Tax=Chryseobacterium sp. SNU WT5 TaxID=2594269 RepID=UPI0011808684|nr:T9SS type A sorting domain-containing protein [Chryseobacterium sp. SNU WT5]QDP84636.1 T9SS type A sorting domain-containing protein [Chryseobacterium sp. SNU WT5]